MPCTLPASRGGNQARGTPGAPSPQLGAGRGRGSGSRIPCPSHPRVPPVEGFSWDCGAGAGRSKGSGQPGPCRGQARSRETQTKAGFTISSGTGRDPRPFQGPVASRAKIFLCRTSSPHQGRFSTSSLNHLFVPVLDFHFSTENHRRIPNLWHKPLQDSPPCTPPALDLIPPRGAEGSRATLLSPGAGSIPSRPAELSPAPLRGPGWG